MSETGAGTVRDLRARAEWLGQTRGPEVNRTTFGRWMRDISALGHLEIDWSGGRWSITPPAVVRLPRADGVAVLAGARRYGLLEALASTNLAVTEHAVAMDGAALTLPATVFVQFDSVAQLRESATEAGVTYAGCFTLRAASMLGRLALGPVAAPPSLTNETLMRRSGPRDDDWAPQSALAAEFADGMYRFELNGRKDWYTVRSGSWHRTGLSEGTFLELARIRQSCLSWRAEPGQGRETVGTVFVDFGAPLPPLQARALTLCSGIPPRMSETAKNLAYRNVPQGVARSVAHSLLQEIEEQPHGPNRPGVSART